MSVGVSSTELCQRLPQLPAKVQFRYVRIADMQILFVYGQVDLDFLFRWSWVDYFKNALSVTEAFCVMTSSVSIDNTISRFEIRCSL